MFSETFEFLQSSNQKYLHFLTRYLMYKHVWKKMRKTNLFYVSENWKKTKWIIMRVFSTKL